MTNNELPPEPEGIGKGYHYIDLEQMPRTINEMVQLHENMPISQEQFKFYLKAAAMRKLIEDRKSNPTCMGCNFGPTFAHNHR